MRPAIVIIAFLPFAYYAAKDLRFHFVGRQVSLAEHVLHLAIGICLGIVLTQAVLGHSGFMLVGLLLLVICGSADEYLWHRGIPEVESDLHAKEHLALLIFVVSTLTVNWLEDHQWQLPRELLDTFAFAKDNESVDGAISGQTGVSEHRWLRGGLISACLLPYAYFGLNDNLHHVRHREVSWTERILHLTIVLAVFTVVPNAIVGHRSMMMVGLLLFLIARSFDEWGFHRNLPGNEADMHAKTHYAFLVFVVLLTSIDWITHQTGA
ncbi:MAG: hypothetical protein R3B91_08575 [Planctomycetaceae bacterium]